MQTEISTLEKLTSLVQDLESQVHAVFRTYTVALNDLGSSPWNLAHPILVTIEQHAADDFVAGFYDADIYGYGDSIPSSLEDLKRHIVNQYEFLLNESQGVKLGPTPTEQLHVLEKYLKKADTDARP